MTKGISAIVGRGLNRLRTIVHVGAHLAEELEVYLALYPHRIIWIEADPDQYQKLEKRLLSSNASSKCDILWINACVTDCDGGKVDFFRFNNDGLSSSIFKSTEQLRSNWTGISETDENFALRTRRLDSIFKSLNIEIIDDSLLILDIQGAELLALRGMGIYLTKFKWIEVEVSTEAIYEGAPLYPVIDEFLRHNGFQRISDVPWHGDVVYERLEIAEKIEITKQQVQTINTISARFEQTTAINKFSGLAKSQLGQDVFVLSETGFKRNGFFVEFGATNGINLSNSYLLEKLFDWHGILAEPAKTWHDLLKKNRSASIDTNCVWSSSGESLIFNETTDPELSTIDSMSNVDNHAASRVGGEKYSVSTISLNDLLKKYNAPEVIDYLSIDTEGSEYEILRHLDFRKYKFKIITCEHNYSSSRELIYQLLIGHGYQRKYEALSQWDDWYVYVG